MSFVISHSSFVTEMASGRDEEMGRWGELFVSPCLLSLPLTLTLDP